MQALRFIAIAIYGLCFSLAHAETLTGQVVKIADGDTFLTKPKRLHEVRGDSRWAQ
ncbi:hypothetical protein SAMN05216386_1683 [Nitrosospira briensis]|uniref:Uncharacterized protein n=1 Tax=Nitrosospira briensis TaxID=35799 RepID=A0A1I5BI97_9PROT|nr:hypothetical protein [Nitrosospira briensis]SFN74387.1 hypothetical protein SAMN05216386_1683 [Nitrosospira briensis]